MKLAKELHQVLKACGPRRSIGAVYCVIDKLHNYLPSHTVSVPPTSTFKAPLSFIGAATKPLPYEASKRKHRIILVTMNRLSETFTTMPSGGI